MKPNAYLDCRREGGAQVGPIESGTSAAGKARKGSEPVSRREEAWCRRRPGQLACVNPGRMEGETEGGKEGREEEGRK